MDGYIFADSARYFEFVVTNTVRFQSFQKLRAVFRADRDYGYVVYPARVKRTGNIHALAARVERGDIGGIFVKRSEALYEAMQVKRRAKRQCDDFHIISVSFFAVDRRSVLYRKSGRVVKQIALGFGVPQAAVLFD